MFKVRTPFLIHLGPKIIVFSKGRWELQSWSQPGALLCNKHIYINVSFWSIHVSTTKLRTFHKSLSKMIFQNEDLPAYVPNQFDSFFETQWPVRLYLNRELRLSATNLYDVSWFDSNNVFENCYLIFLEKMFH